MATTLTTALSEMVKMEHKASESMQALSAKPGDKEELTRLRDATALQRGLIKTGIAALQTLVHNQNATQPPVPAKIEPIQPQGQPPIDEVRIPSKRPRTYVHDPEIPVYEQEGQLPPLCGAISLPREETLGRGSRVAANVMTSARRSGEKSWILGVIAGFDENSKKYTVEDADPSHVDRRDIVKHTCTRDNLVPLPKYRPPRWTSKTIFPRGTRVLAMFPDTTTFYPAHVIQAPVKKNDDLYVLEFVDDDQDGVGNQIQREVSAAFCVLEQ